MTDRILKFARAYIARGWQVIPLHGIQDGKCTCKQGAKCGRAGKHPRINDWTGRASTDPGQIEAWFSGRVVSNIGIVTGEASDLLVLDVDMPEGPVSLAAQPELPPTLSARTGSGGVHHLFSFPKDGHPYGNSVRRLGDGLDTRGYGGQIVAPPSCHHNGQEYKWSNRLPITDCPTWVLDLLREESNPSESQDIPWKRDWMGKLDRPSSGGERDYGLTALAGECDEIRAAVKGTRNHTLNRCSYRVGRLIGGNLLDDSIAREALMEAAIEVGLSREESTATIESGVSDGIRNPRVRKPRRSESKSSRHVRSADGRPDHGSGGQSGDFDSSSPGGSGVAEESARPAWLDGAPIPLIPPGWSISSKGVFDTSRDPVKCASPVPVYITDRLRDVLNSDESVTITWRDRKSWRSTHAPRDVVMSARSIVGLAKEGVPVSSAHAGLLVRFFADQLAMLDMPMEETISRLGWFKDKGFVLGPTDVIGDCPRYSAPAGMEHLLRGFQSGGTLDAWKATMRGMQRHPRAMLAVWASFTAPLLHFVPSMANLILDYSGKTSSGKTTALRMAASVWGRPDERSDGTIHTWQTTRVGLERLAEAHHHLPLCLDDHTRAARPHEIPGFIYDFSIGQGRTRGRADGGLQHRAGYRGLLISTGEMPLVARSQDAGTRARVLSVWGSPIENADGDFVVSLNRSLLSDFGHAGRAYIQAIHDSKDVQHSITVEYERFCAAFVQTSNSEVGHRLAHGMAAIATGGLIASRLGLIPFKESDAELIWMDLLREGESDSDKPLLALHHAYGWAQANQHRFYGVHQRDEHHAGWAGCWKDSGNSGYIGFHKHVLKPVLEDAGYDFEAIVRQWSDAGWLRKEAGRRTLKVRAKGGSMWRVVAVSNLALIEQGVGDTSATVANLKPMEDNIRIVK